MQYQQRLRNIQKSEEIGNDCLPSFDTDSDLFSTDFTCNSLSAAGSKSICNHIQDHTYISDGAFAEINENFFAGKLRSLDSTRFILDLETFFSNMKCTQCDHPLQFKESIGVLPTGVCGHLVVKCCFCFKFVKVPMGKMHALQNTDHKPIVFDVNTKIATGMYKII